ncbi:hypothetical protein CHUAL_009590 [Chamberlinius hualienensis]
MSNLFLTTLPVPFPVATPWNALPLLQLEPPPPVAVSSLQLLLATSVLMPSCLSILTSTHSGITHSCCVTGPFTETANGFSNEGLQY